MSWSHGGCLGLCIAACQVHKVSVCNNIALNNDDDDDDDNNSNDNDNDNDKDTGCCCINYFLNYKLPVFSLNAGINSFLQLHTSQ